MVIYLNYHDRNQLEAFRRKHRTALLTIIFTDLVHATEMKDKLGDSTGVDLIQQYYALVRDLLDRFSEGEEIKTAGDSFLIVFVKPSDAVKFSLLLQRQLRVFFQDKAFPLANRIGIHLGEVVVEEEENSDKTKDLYGIQVDTCARILSLCEEDQILITRSVYDNAQQVLKGQTIEGVKTIHWKNHGSFEMKGLSEPIEIYEVKDKEIIDPPPIEEITRFLERKQSVNLVVRGSVKWREWIGCIARDRIKDLAIVDLENPATVSRQGLLVEILKALRIPVQIPKEPNDLAEFSRILSERPLSRVALTHFDLAPHRESYDVNFYAALRYMMMESRNLVLLIQSRKPFHTLLPPDNPLSTIDIKTVEYQHPHETYIS